MPVRAPAPGSRARPTRRIHSSKIVLVDFAQWKIPRVFRGEKFRTTRRWAATHEHLRIVVMEQSDGMAQFMRDDVASDIWQGQRKKTVMLDSNQRLVADRLANRKRDEISAR